MTKISSTLGVLLLATSALTAPALAFAQPQDAETAPPLAAEAAPEETTEVGEIVVRGRFIPEVMRETSEVASVLLPEDLARQGDDNAAEALNRVTGLTLVDGRFIYVRGLGERYSSALLNGSPLPSPEPLQRVVPLDLFPSNILGGAVVQKTYSPQYPGEFGGGVINLQTITAPARSYFSIGASVGANWETTLGPGFVYYGSDTDWTGFDDGARELPSLVREATRAGRGRISTATFDSVDLARIGADFVNAPLNLLQSTKDVPANYSVEVGGGHRFDFGWGDFGVLGVAGFDSSWHTRRGVQEEGFVADGVIEPQTHYDFMSTQNDVVVNGLLGLGLNVGEHDIRWTNLYVRNVTKEARSRAGFDFNSPVGDVRDDYTEWFQRELASTQLAGNLEFGPLEIDWRGAMASTRRYTPYQKAIRYFAVGDEYLYGNRNSTAFGKVRDDLASAGVDFKYTLALSDERDAVFSAGYAISDNDRKASDRTFEFQSTSLPVEIQRERVDFLFSDYNLFNGFFTLRETTGDQSAYEGQLDVDAFYVQADVEILPLVRVALGVRHEDAVQSLTLKNLFGADPVSPPALEESYWLPAATITWNFYEDMQLRLGASKTIARPQFRELAPQTYLDPDTDRAFFGNPFLTDTELMNLDARFEWYFGRNQFLAASLFYKDLDRPVEAALFDTGSGGVVTTYINAPRAELLGVELETRRYLDQVPLLGGAIEGESRWFVAANYTWTTSELRVEPGDLVFPFEQGGMPVEASQYFDDGDQLQGQSEHLANVQIGFEDAEGLQLTLLANYASDRISARGRPGFPDLVVTPPVMLDFTARKTFDMGDRGTLVLGFEARNLLDEDYDETQSLGGGNVTILGYPIGRSVSFSATRRF